MNLKTTIIGIIIAVSIISSTVPALGVFAAKPGDASDDPKGKPSDPEFLGRSNS